MISNHLTEENETMLNWAKLCQRNKLVIGMALSLKYKFMTTTLSEKLSSCLTHNIGYRGTIQKLGSNYKNVW